jgi:hypothetical protein
LKNSPHLVNWSQAKLFFDENKIVMIEFDNTATKLGYEILSDLKA